MIENGAVYAIVLTLIALLIVTIEKKSTIKLFAYLPSIVILYFVVMLFSTMGIWEKSPSVNAVYTILKSNILPAMIFLLLLSANMREILLLGRKMLLTFFLASLSIALGFVGMFTLMHTQFDPNGWKSFAALAGSWMGGTGNMVAIQSALHLPDHAMGYTLLIDSIDYAIWVMVLLGLVPLANRFNRWSGADTSLIDAVGERLEATSTPNKPILVWGFVVLVALAFFVSQIAQIMANFFPSTPFLTTETWVVILSTLAGILAAMTPVAKIGDGAKLGNGLLYLMVALIASRANFSELTQAPFYILAGVMIILIHALMMVIFAKLFKLDLFSLGVASLANIGGVASAPILASAYSKALIPIGVLMAMLGYIIGTFGGLMVGKILAYISG